MRKPALSFMIQSKVERKGSKEHMATTKGAYKPKVAGIAMPERRRRIRALIEENAQGTVAELAEEFGVSAVTIRADLAALEQMGAVVRTHGGALPRGDSVELPIDPFEPVGADIAFRHARIYPAQKGLARGSFVEHAMQVGCPDATRRIQHPVVNPLAVDIQHEQR